jgi:hypothetical protein
MLPNGPDHARKMLIHDRGMNVHKMKQIDIGNDCSKLNYHFLPPNKPPNRFDIGEVMVEISGSEFEGFAAFLALIKSAAFSATAYIVACKCVAGIKGIMLASTMLRPFTPYTAKSLPTQPP